MKQIKHILLVILFLSAPNLWAQQQSTMTNEPGKGFRRGVAAVMFATIGGAVLGLSTLSFYGKPQEHTGNITTGALLGLIGGIGYVSYNATKVPKPSGSYDFSRADDSDLKLRRASARFVKADVSVVQFQYDF